MKQAKSILLGGEIINVEQANHETCKKYQLVCPFCSQALFYREGGTKIYKHPRYKVKETNFQASFCHYGQGHEAERCEERSYSTQGQKQIKANAIASKNQRLDLYNKRLWDLFVFSHEIDTRAFKDLPRRFRSIQKSLRRGFFEALAKDFINAYPKIEWEMLDKIELILTSKDLVNIEFLEQTTKITLEALVEQYNNDQIAAKYHLKIIKELREFLSTKTSMFFWKKYSEILTAEILKEYYPSGDVSLTPDLLEFVQKNNNKAKESFLKIFACRWAYLVPLFLNLGDFSSEELKLLPVELREKPK